MANLWKKKLFAAVVITGCLCATTLSSGAMANDAGGPPVRADLRGHSEPVLVVFGARVEFRHYLLVTLLSDFMTVTTDSRGDVRYDLENTSEGRTLIIN